MFNEKDLDISLREYFDAKLLAQKEIFDTKMDATQKALLLREKQIDQEMEHLNRLRIEVMADRGQYQTIAVSESKEKDASHWRESISTRLTTIETRSITWTAAISLFFVVLTIALRFIIR